ncbi:MAG: LuxR C-terminal-related transcriptional regulator [Pseudonocardia sediminis]
MSAPAAPRESEWLDLVADLMQTPLTSWPDEMVARQLVETFDAAGCVSHVHSAAAGLTLTSFRPVEHFAPYLEEAMHWTMYDAPRRHPLLRYHLATGLGTCLQVDDVPSGIADRRIVEDWRALGRRWGGVQAQASIPVLSTPGEMRSFVVGRTDSYTAQEMATMRRIQRLLAGLERQIGVFSRWSARTGPAGLDVADAVRLTPRELTVLALLAPLFPPTRGSLTAAAIGRRLGVSERTVQKHLQRIYAKLGVSDRLGAVCRAQTVGLLPVPRLAPAPSPERAAGG